MAYVERVRGLHTKNSRKSGGKKKIQNIADYVSYEVLLRAEELSKQKGKGKKL